MRDLRSSFSRRLEKRMLLFAGIGLLLMSGVLLAGGFAEGLGRPAACPAPGARARAAELGTLTFVTGRGRQDFVVEIMRQPCDLQRGLMYRRSLPSDRGMVFVFPGEGFVPMWMKNTYIPLDMVFLENRKVVSVAENTEPLSERVIVPPAPVDRVVELNAGVAARIGLRQGDTVELAPLVR